MASDNHANYGRIGFTVFVGAIALAISLIYLAGIGNKESEYLVETYYDHPVSGLSVGSPVNFRGVKVGEVREICFVGAKYDEEEMTTNDFQRIIIVMALDCRRLEGCTADEARQVTDKFVGAGLRATVMSNPVTGMSRVEFNIPSNPVPLAELKWKPRYHQIPPQPSLFENFSVSLARALNTINKVNVPLIWSNISVVASSSAKITRDVSEFISTEKTGLSAIFSNIEETTDSINELADSLKENPSLLLRQRDPEPLPETK